MKAIQLTATDNVATVLDTTPAGTEVQILLNGETLGTVVAKEEIPFGFKICSREIPAGGAVTKYSHVIGRASRLIAAGELVHVHNIDGNRGRGDLE